MLKRHVGKGFGSPAEVKKLGIGVLGASKRKDRWVRKRQL